MAEKPPHKTAPLSFVPSETVAAEIRRLAVRDEVSQADVLRRLVRRGLETERRDASHGEAA